ncbi:hypothetical protein CANARDRAFT_180660, partial [[Candida] arabinofermentans NRRL YB-2248]
RVLILIIGQPGSGKTTVSKKIESLLNKKISMDGFHLPVSVLQQFPDPEHAIEKRGSPATFDAGQVVKLIELIPTITTPDFSHELKDPSPGGTTIQPETRVVIMEGLYLLLKDSKPWCGIPELIINNNDKLVCEVWKINVPQSIARSRVSQRHLDSGLVTSLQKGVQRYDENDLPNGILVD